VCVCVCVCVCVYLHDISREIKLESACDPVFWDQNCYQDHGQISQNHFLPLVTFIAQ